MSAAFVFAACIAFSLRCSSPDRDSAATWSRRACMAASRCSRMCAVLTGSRPSAVALRSAYSLAEAATRGQTSAATTTTPRTIHPYDCIYHQHQHHLRASRGINAKIVPEAPGRRGCKRSAPQVRLTARNASTEPRISQIFTTGGACSMSPIASPKTPESATAAVARVVFRLRRLRVGECLQSQGQRGCSAPLLAHIALAREARAGSGSKSCRGTLRIALQGSFCCRRVSSRQRQCR
jgi:hypothetical protein